MAFPTQSRTDRLTPYALIALATTIAVLHLLLHGPSCGHDLTFHVLNWLDAARQWRLGTVRPWWCFPAAWNTGEPRYLFYPPLSWLLGALLTVVTGTAQAPIAFTAIALFTCGVTMRNLLLRYTAAPVALFGGFLYLANPYMLFTAFERTAYAELLAAAWFPWLLCEALRDRIRPATLAIPVGLLWITNTPAAILATYTLATVLLVRTARELRNRQPTLVLTALPASVGFLWGLAASAFYLLPTLVQHSYVEVDQALTGALDSRNGTLFAHTGEPMHDHVVFQASCIAVALLTTAVLALLAWSLQRRRLHRLAGMRDSSLHHAHRSEQAKLLPMLAILSAAVLFLFLPASLLVWRYAPEFRFVQLPLRTLLLQGGLTTLLIAFALPSRLRLRHAAPLACIAVFALAFTAHHNFAQFCDDEDAPSSLFAQYQRGEGFEPYDEYTPADADNDLLRQDAPPAWTAPTPDTAASPAAATHVLPLQTKRADTLAFRAQPVAGDRFLIIRQRRFPNWHAQLDGQQIQTDPLRDDDLLAIPITPGTHLLQLTYRWSWDQIAGVILSTVAVLAIALFMKLGPKPRPVLLRQLH